jgi:N-carbamoylputrescine amidase
VSDAVLRVTAITMGASDSGLTRALAAAESAIAAAAEEGADLVVLPELFALPYVASDDPARWRHLAEPIDGRVGTWAKRLAGRFDIAILFGMAVASDVAKPVNAAVMATADAGLGICAEKANLPPRDREPFGEVDHFGPGLGPLRVVTIGDVRVTAVVCYDRRYPESWRSAMALGADLVAVLVAGPAADDPAGIYEAELRTHARANAMFVAAAARAGCETALGRPVRHDGVTMTVDCDGVIQEVAETAAGASASIIVSSEALAYARLQRVRRTAGAIAYGKAPKRKSI